MAKRTKKPISLAPISAPRSPIRTARETLKKFEATGRRKPEGPTPERLLHAGDAAVIENFFEVVEIATGDKFEPEPVKFVRMRIEDTPFDRMKKHQQLDRNDVGINRILGMAGDEYRGHFNRTGLYDFKAQDPTKEMVSGGGAGGLFASEASANAFVVYSRAREAMHADFRAVVDAVVIYDQTPEDAGRKIGGYISRQHANAVGCFVLRRGLTELALHFGLMAKEGARK